MRRLDGEESEARSCVRMEVHSDSDLPTRQICAYMHIPSGLREKKIESWDSPLWFGCAHMACRNVRGRLV